MKTNIEINLGDFHFGHLFKSYIKSRKISKAALARNIKRDDSTILYYQKHASVQIAIVWQLSHALKHNFFADIAAQLPSNYTTDTSTDNSQDERIAQLEKELELTKAKYEALAEVMKGK